MSQLSRGWPALAALVLSLFTASAAAAPGAETDDPVLRALVLEIGRAMGEAVTTDPAPYFLAAEVTETESVQISAEEGALQGYAPKRGRWVDVDVRVGGPQLDSTHPLRSGQDRRRGHGRALVISDDVDVEELEGSSDDEPSEDALGGDEAEGIFSDDETNDGDTPSEADAIEEHDAADASDDELAKLAKEGIAYLDKSCRYVEVDLVVMAVGRQPRGDSAGLVDTRVVVDDRGFIQVDDRLRTGEPGVYAVGDVVATPQLAHVGFAEGMFVVKDILGEAPVPLDPTTVPWCIYSHPEVAFAGLTEAAAVEAGHDVVVSSHRLAGNGRARILGDTDGLVKVVAERNSAGRAGRILGVHLVGPWVTEQLGQGYLAVNWEATVDEVAAFIQPHPTLSEMFGETVLALTGRPLHG